MGRPQRASDPGGYTPLIVPQGMVGEQAAAAALPRGQRATGCSLSCLQ